MSTPQTDTPETGNVLESILRDKGELCEDTAPFALVRLCKKLERRAIAAEARAKELESKIADVERRNYDTNRRLSDVLAERAALRLRPIAEAGPVPEGMLRIFVRWSSDGYVINPIQKSTHFIDIYPPQ
jgi:hypothetical protein